MFRKKKNVEPDLEVKVELKDADKPVICLNCKHHKTRETISEIERMEFLNMNCNVPTHLCLHNAKKSYDYITGVKGYRGLTNCINVNYDGKCKHFEPNSSRE